jgi:hypothetical protein
VNSQSRISRLFSFAVLLFITFFGCSDDPNQLGKSLLLPQDMLRIATVQIRATGDTTFSIKTINNSGRLFVGLRDNLEAVSILRFISVPAFTITKVIDSVKLVLVPNYVNGDSLKPFGFTVSNALRSWSGSTFNWDSLPGFISPGYGTYYSSAVSHDSSISIPLDTSLIHLWMQTGTGSLVLRTTPNVLGMNAIAGFANYINSSLDLRPEIQVSYHDTADTTIVLHLRSPGGISVMNETLLPPPSSVVVEAGLIARGLFRFDTLGLPPKVSITEATVYFPVDTFATHLNQYSHDSLFVSMERKNYYPYDSTAFGVTCSPAFLGGKKYYTGDVKNIIQYWVNHGQNYGLLLRPYAENTTVDRTTLYGSHSPVIRPSITITYTALP